MGGCAPASDLRPSLDAILWKSRLVCQVGRKARCHAYKGDDAPACDSASLPLVDLEAVPPSQRDFPMPGDSISPVPSPSAQLSYFSVVVCLRCLLHHIRPRIAYTFLENWDFVLIIIVQFMMSANSRIRYGLQIVFVSLYITPSYYHHYANLSVDIELMKCLPYIFCRVCE